VTGQLDSLGVDTDRKDYADEITSGTAPTSRNTPTGHITPPSA
jgi:hypothetical protein